MLPAISVVIPAFNEAVRIGDTLATSIAYLEKVSPGSELIVINDGSTDSTGEVIRKVAAVPSSVAIRLLENFPNRGKGAAVRSGLLSATKPIAVFFDADLSTPIDELPKIVEPIARGEVDIAFGSRALNRKLIGNRQPWRREQGGRVFNLLVRVATGLPFWTHSAASKRFEWKHVDQLSKPRKSSDLALTWSCFCSRSERDCGSGKFQCGGIIMKVARCVLFTTAYACYEKCYRCARTTLSSQRPNPSPVRNLTVGE